MFKYSQWLVWSVEVETDREDPCFMKKSSASICSYTITYSDPDMPQKRSSLFEKVINSFEKVFQPVRCPSPVVLFFLAAISCLSAVCLYLF